MHTHTRNTRTRCTPKHTLTHMKNTQGNADSRRLATKQAPELVGRSGREARKVALGLCVCRVSEYVW